MALQAWLDGNWMLPQTQGAVVPNPKTLKETMVSLTPEASVNQIKALQYVLAHACPQTLLSPSSPTSSLHSPGLQPGRGVQKWTTTSQPGQTWGP